jgi:hypothetical protein
MSESLALRRDIASIISNAEAALEAASTPEEVADTYHRPMYSVGKDVTRKRTQRKNQKYLHDTHSTIRRSR